MIGPIGALLALPLTATGTALASTYFQRHEVVETKLTQRRRVRRKHRRTRPGPGNALA